MYHIIIKFLEDYSRKQPYVKPCFNIERLL